MRNFGGTVDSPSAAFFLARLKFLLREEPSGTTAELTDVAVAYLDVDGLVGIFLAQDGSGDLDEEFALDENAWLNWSPELDAWLDSPVFRVRAGLAQWRARRHGRLQL
jgi:hypothetical protein